MAEQKSSQDTPRAAGAPGMFASLRAALVTVLGIAGTRFELIGIEVAEEKERLVVLLVTAIAALLAFAFAALMLTVLVVIFYWDVYRFGVIGIFAVLYSLLGYRLVKYLKYQLATHPSLFAATIAELEKDRETLQSAIKQQPATRGDA